MAKTPRITPPDDRRSSPGTGIRVSEGVAFKGMVSGRSASGKYIAHPSKSLKGGVTISFGSHASSAPGKMHSEDSTARAKGISKWYKRMASVNDAEMYRKVMSQDPRSQAEALGAKPGVHLAAADAKVVLKKITGLCTDVFQTTDKAASYFRSPNFAGTGTDALKLIEEGGAATVLSRIDELRYGSRG